MHLTSTTAIFATLVALATSFPNTEKRAGPIEHYQITTHPDYICTGKGGLHYTGETGDKTCVETSNAHSFKLSTGLIPPFCNKFHVMPYGKAGCTGKTFEPEIVNGENICVSATPGYNSFQVYCVN